MDRGMLVVRERHPEMAVGAAPEEGVDVGGGEV